MPVFSRQQQSSAPSSLKKKKHFNNENSISKNVLRRRAATCRIYRKYRQFPVWDRKLPKRWCPKLRPRRTVYVLWLFSPRPDVPIRPVSSVLQYRREPSNSYRCPIRRRKRTILWNNGSKRRRSHLKSLQTIVCRSHSLDQM